MSKIQTIDQQFGEPGNHKASYLHTFKMGSHTLRVQIAGDQHRPQSYARIEKWDGNQWHQVHCIKPHEMKTQDGYGVRGKFTVAHFAEDEKRLIEVAKKIICPDPREGHQSDI